VSSVIGEKYHNIDTSGVHGLWITCGASLSPWNTHRSSEEYEPDAFKIEKNDEFKGYSKAPYGDETKANPYHYGRLPEITVNPDGTGNGWTYIMSHFQHPGDWEKGKGGKPGLHDVVKEKVAPLIDENFMIASAPPWAI